VADKGRGLREKTAFFAFHAAADDVCRPGPEDDVFLFVGDINLRRKKRGQAEQKGRKKRQIEQR
jgi:hypothetical protein